MRGLTVAVAAALIGCGDDHAGVDADAGDAARPKPTPCWPQVVRTPQGSATLGTGRDGFEPMPAVLPLEYGTQDGYNLVATVRMTGFAPGNPQNILDPGNPRTRIRAFFDDNDVPLNYYGHCPFRLGYVPIGGGSFELVEAAPIIFETCWRSEHLFGQRIRIELEMMDDRGGYTTDVKIVTAAPPTSYYPVDQGTLGCPFRFDQRAPPDP